MKFARGETKFAEESSECASQKVEGSLDWERVCVASWQLAISVMERVSPRSRTNKHVAAIVTGRHPRFHPGGVSSFPASWRSFYRRCKSLLRAIQLERSRKERLEILVSPCHEAR